MKVVKWLLEGETWVEHQTRVDLLCQPKDKTEVASARQHMFEHPKIQSQLEELRNWPRTVLSSHKSTNQP